MEENNDNKWHDEQRNADELYDALGSGAELSIKKGLPECVNLLFVHMKGRTLRLWRINAIEVPLVQLVHWKILYVVLPAA
jgi:hypothetical protein